MRSWMSSEPVILDSFFLGFNVVSGGDVPLHTIQQRELFEKRTNGTPCYGHCVYLKIFHFPRDGTRGWWMCQMMVWQVPRHAHTVIMYSRSCTGHQPHSFGIIVSRRSVDDGSLHSCPQSCLGKPGQLSATGWASKWRLPSSNPLLIISPGSEIGLNVRRLCFEKQYIIHSSWGFCLQFACVNKQRKILHSPKNSPVGGCSVARESFSRGCACCILKLWLGIIFVVHLPFSFYFRRLWNCVSSPWSEKPRTYRCVEKGASPTDRRWSAHVDSARNRAIKATGRVPAP